MAPEPDRPCILIIDDEIQMRYYLKTLVGSLKMRAVLARDGEEGLEQLENVRPDLIILDIMMPNKGGVRVYQHLIHNPDLAAIPVIFFSGVDKSTFLHFLKMVNAGNPEKLPEPAHYIPKDADAGCLIDEICQILEQGEGRNST